jgi:hypothetical protein
MKDDNKTQISIIDLIIYEFEAMQQWIAELERYKEERIQAEEEREKMIRELQKALSEVRTIKGILTICASCTKIRDDKGCWMEIKAYIQNHSETQFSHGICPDCMKKIYPDFHREGK